MNQCPCASLEPIEKCCGPFLAGEAIPETPEALMRSRYTAFTQGNMDYIIKTHAPESLEDFDEDANREWAEGSEWLGLDIHSTEAGGKDDDTGFVTFTAKYSQMGAVHSHREHSTFKKIDDRWYFHSGITPNQGTVRREETKVGRNDPCRCGSGKKFKKCCLRAG